MTKAVSMPSSAKLEGGVYRGLDKTRQYHSSLKKQFCPETKTTLSISQTAQGHLM
jgi:hypothetical protein